MAEKEERIEISKYDLNNKEWNGDIPIDIHKVYTRQEAIGCIAKALCGDDVMREGYYQMAEAALNGLLEGK